MHGCRFCHSVFVGLASAPGLVGKQKRVLLLRMLLLMPKCSRGEAGFGPAVRGQSSGWETRGITSQCPASTTEWGVRHSQVGRGREVAFDEAPEGEEGTV